MANKKPLPPATGICRWVDLSDKSAPKLYIEVEGKRGPVSQTYSIRPTEQGYQLLYTDPDTMKVVRYDVFILLSSREEEGEVEEKWVCDCPDATNRPERQGNCKHILALKSALPRLPKEVTI